MSAGVIHMHNYNVVLAELEDTKVVLKKKEKELAEVKAELEALKEATKKRPRGRPRKVESEEE